MKQPLAYVHPDAKIANNVVIEPFVTIDKNVIIGEGTQIFWKVRVLAKTAKYSRERLSRRFLRT